MMMMMMIEWVVLTGMPMKDLSCCVDILAVVKKRQIQTQKEQGRRGD
jgi:hypothetical protein